MKITRRKSKIIRIGNVFIGGNHPIAIQSMTKTRTADIEKTLQEIKKLERCGCEIVRLAVKDGHDALALKKIKQKAKLPIVADIHFNWRLALEAIDSGVDKIRLNPGNIYKEDQIREVVCSLKQAKIPLRIGVNSGSVRELNSKRLSMADRLVSLSLNYIRIIEKLGFYDIVISLKASNVTDTLEAYRKIAKLCQYPLHLGVTATGSAYSGAIKSSMCLGALLLEGIGDTIRVSLTDKPVNEVKVARIILESLGLRSFSPQIISCPTCGRCEVDLPKLVKEVEQRLSAIDYKPSDKPATVAIMGCVVNGPGEAAQADIGVAFGKERGLLFKKGKPVRKVSFAECKDVLLRELLKK
ncbi:MAG: flavodoxin-dependent (E)-4-hydroxy-3-methylbut-2-enyl-diphosphate synthase [Candidatus Omnitrophica bacterium]|nr:flavodoxin-dependent (E)-4-hydroxy-3-methylbut-2-enyl-diphosphate synthase [Candidatus Omnitrophota bacterium]MDD5238325.1 flavodoxin-dependent (E)-4-hydroxy-3-methylbut-2-enyl-diphosphate synthase [Candidatus Omnitrophota bacterium]